ncbi:M16 family metallopeptidase [Natronoglycomyces albus]|nr:pitrilysin family protein [Natronoglycomyces albus]
MIPQLAPETPLVLPEAVCRVLPGGISTTVVRRASVPIAEMRLSIPMTHIEPALADLLASTITNGTKRSSLRGIAERLQSIGGSLHAGSSPDQLSISGFCLASQLPAWLDILGELLTEATFPADPFHVEQERISDSISVAEQQPDYLVNRRLNHRLWEGHPYAHQHPSAGEIKAVTRDDVEKLYRERVHPDRARLVVVGDIDEATIFDLLTDKLGAWVENVTDEVVVSDPMPPLPQFAPSGIEIVDRPGSVQSAIRVVFPAIDRRHPDNAAQHLANLIYGGYFSSRLVLNLREEKGYGYTPRSIIDHSPAGTYQLIHADVATEVTSLALREVHHELRRMAEETVGEDELAKTRQYALGALKIGTSANSSLASFISSLASCGLTLDYLASHTERLLAVTPADVRRVARERLNLDRSVTVILGEAESIEAPLRALGDVTVAQSI